MKRVNKILALFLCAVMFTGALTAGALAAEKTGLENFKKTNAWQEGMFSDVTSADWFYENVKAAYELGLMIGRGGKFGAADSITVAETVTLAARLHSVYTADGASFVQGDPWYKVYVDYVESCGLADLKGLDMKAAATRAQFAYILSSAFPAEGLAAINNVSDGAVPDVASDDRYADAIYSLYRSGVLTGNDSKGTFYPRNSIKRSEVAAIVTRMADASLRKSVTLNPGLVTEAFTKTVTFTVRETDEKTGKETPVTYTYEYSVPKINLKSAKVDQINANLYKTFTATVRDCETEVIAYGMPMSSAGVSYQWYVNGDVLSLVVLDLGSTVEAYGSQYYIFDISISTGETMTVGDVVRAAGFSIVEYATKAAEELESTFKLLYGAPEASYKAIYDECLAKTVSYDNVQQCIPYLNERGDLCMAGYIYPIAGPEKIQILVGLEAAGL